MELSSHWAFNILNDPKRLGFVWARYELARNFAGECRNVLELGCSEGLGAPILAGENLQYLGSDLDEEAIHYAKQNYDPKQFSFLACDFMGRKFGEFDLVVSLDVVEHIERRDESAFLSTITDNLAERGIAVVGTPNITSAPYASAASNAGHVNLFSSERLVEFMSDAFANVFLFGINDEVVHTGFGPMCHYLVAVGVNRRAVRANPQIHKQ